MIRTRKRLAMMEEIMKKNSVPILHNKEKENSKTYTIQDVN